MTELLPKEDRNLSSVSKNAAAIFLLITTMFIGSISNANATEMTAAETTSSVVNLLGLPTPESFEHTLFDVPTMRPVPMFWNPDKLEDVIVSNDPHIPILSGMVTSSYGWRKHPVKGGRKHHNGLDIAAKLGMPVLAPASGIVVFSGVRNGYGNVVEIDHGNGYVSLLAHHSKLLVKAGDVVDSTTVIAKAGRTGYATGVHVHVEVRQHGRLLNPRVFLTK